VARSNPSIVGFTLIEVLIALAILSIALTAMIKATSQTIKNTIYIQEKTIAHWVGLKVMNEALSGFITLPTQSDSLSDTTEMLGENWDWEAHTQATQVPTISRIQVDVFQQPHHLKMTSLVSYRYAKPQS
jgi:general secretion pathway protein I